MTETDHFMLLCGSCNRAKSWSCEQCENWTQIHDTAICLDCYWANPTRYTHIMQQPIRRLDVVWQGDEVRAYDAMMAAAALKNLDLPDFVKALLKRINQPPSR